MLARESTGLRARWTPSLELAARTLGLAWQAYLCGEDPSTDKQRIPSTLPSSLLRHGQKTICNETLDAQRLIIMRRHRCSRAKRSD